LPGPGLTSADCDGLRKLLPPAVGPDQQGQVGLLEEFIHGALQDKKPQEVTGNNKKSQEATRSYRKPQEVTGKEVTGRVTRSHRKSQEVTQ